MKNTLTNKVILVLTSSFQCLEELNASQSHSAAFSPKNNIFLSFLPVPFFPAVSSKMLVVPYVSLELVAVCVFFFTCTSVPVLTCVCDAVMMVPLSLTSRG